MSNHEQSEFEAEVNRAFAALQRAGLANHGSISAASNELASEEAEADQIGVCRIRRGSSSGCFPGMTRGACEAIAFQLDAQADWEAGGRCP